MGKTSAQPASPVKPLRLAVLLSGGGRTMVNLAEKIEDGLLHARIAAVISSRADAAGIQRARERSLHVEIAPRKQLNSTAEFSDVVWKLVRKASADLVCLAGFMSLLNIPDDFVSRVVNIHPALLPSFGGPGMYGRHVHEAVLAAGCKVSGCTVHFCDQTYDTGPIIVQRTCPVLEDDTPDTLAARVFEQECLAYPEALNLLAAGRVKIAGRRTRIAPA
ncbi:MAG: phosphoribosylglycinamide formyltransferase [Phycisphaeraceae bacterium]|nr:phosphoribosylglycinamide formyltransferase [Phycisphaeraceae bacterium]